MNHLPLLFRKGHLFVELGGEQWLIDTGAPSSFSDSARVTIAGEQFAIGSSYLGLDAEELSALTDQPCVGLLGADILGRFDHIFDTGSGKLMLSKEELHCDGTSIQFKQIMGIPIVTARIGDTDYQMFFDTGAQISYLRDGVGTEFPSGGSVMDFYPGIGRFQTATHLVPLALGGQAFTLRCGRLPEPLRWLLLAQAVDGIIGNEVFADRTIGYFPRRQVMVL